MAPTLVIAFLALIGQQCFCVELEASDIAKRVATRAKNAIEESSWGYYKNFGTWNYEGAMMFRGLWEIQAALELHADFDIEPFLHDRLNFYQLDPDQFGYKILHNESLSLNGSSIFWPWLLSIGDNIGLFPIVFGDRQRHAKNIHQTDEEKERDVYVMEETVQKYIFGYPWHLQDETISRPYSWPSEGLLELEGKALWVDDIYMGTSLMSELAYHRRNQSYALRAAQDILRLQWHLLMDDDDEFILVHGFNARSGHYSCCKWARGNGWALMGAVEALEAMQLFDELKQSDIFETLLENFQYHAGNLSLWQSSSDDGRWHNLIKDQDSILETSASAMYLYAFLKGVDNDWLDSETFMPCIKMAWNGLKQAIDFDGTVHDIIGETGIKDQAADYEPSSTRYCDAAPGLGAVLRAIAAVVNHQDLLDQ